MFQTTNQFLVASISKNILKTRPKSTSFDGLPENAGLPNYPTDWLLLILDKGKPRTFWDTPHYDAFQISHRNYSNYRHQRKSPSFPWKSPSFPQFFMEISRFSHGLGWHPQPQGLPARLAPRSHSGCATSPRPAPAGRRLRGANPGFSVYHGIWIIVRLYIYIYIVR